MCGILGVFGSGIKFSQDTLSLLVHRGPDSHQLRQFDQAILGHTRLAIMDVEHGEQPMHNRESDHWLICNGEIYNHQTLRDHVPDYPFQTTSDNEVILALYQKYGTDAVKHLEGMFAFVIVDIPSHTVYMARDPLGIKPLYYGWQNDTLYFASEIKALQNKVSHIEEFPPGHWYSNNHGLHRYFDLSQIADEAYQRAALNPATPQDVRQSLRRAVQKRLMSDVPLGVYLSGGLDSTIVATLTKESMPTIHSFAVGIPGSTDLENARLASAKLNTEHHEYQYTLQEMMHALPEIIYYLESYDPLLVRSAIPNYFLARMTRDWVKVVLTGEGADELYAGYHYLKELDGNRLQNELVSLMGTLYNCNLQRCDRMTMAHSIEGRVPFLDIAFIKTSFAVPLNQKIYRQRNKGALVEKWALRQAFDGIAPDNVVWRKKEQFSKGAGSSTMIETIAEQQISDSEFQRDRKRIKDNRGVDIFSKEMLFYYREFERQFSESTHSIIKPWIGRDIA